jgi:hypothetical protein
MTNYTEEFINAHWNEIEFSDIQEMIDDIMEEFEMEYNYFDDEHAPYIVYKGVDDYYLISDVCDANYEVKHYVFNKIWNAKEEDNINV